MAPLPQPSPPVANSAPPATHRPALGANAPPASPVPPPAQPSCGSSRGKGPAPLSPDATPFFPGETSGRSKSMRWAEYSDDCSDFDTNLDLSPDKPPSYCEVIRRGAPTVDPDLAGLGDRQEATVVEMPPVETAPMEVDGQPGGKRRRRRRHARRNPRVLPGPVDHNNDRIPVHLRLGSREAATRRGEARPSVHQHLGPQPPPPPPRRPRRISPPDAQGWWEILPREPTDAQRLKAHAPRPPRKRRIPDAMRDRCLNCLSYSHKIATCRLPLRCLRCHEFRHFARDCKRSRMPENARRDADQG